MRSHFITLLLASLWMFVSCDHPSISSNNTNTNNASNNGNNNNNNGNNTNNTNNTSSCRGDTDCPVTEYCDPCATASCENCTDCVADCRPHECATEPEPACDEVRPECGEGGVAVVGENGCWTCVELGTCLPWRDPSCDDGTEVTCATFAEPRCAEGEMLAIQNGCYVCVNPATCLPWGTAECFMDDMCAPDEYCNPWGTTACPECAQAIAACTPNPCDEGHMLACYATRPQCGPGNAAVVTAAGCWECRSLDTCEPLARDEHCDDGSEVTCATFAEVVCAEHELLAVQEGCYVCVNPTTCLPWGVRGCEGDSGCSAFERCDACASSSCPVCDDCLPACIPHGCPSEPEALCDMMRPDCGSDAVSVVRSGCWVCVDPGTCDPIPGW